SLTAGTASASCTRLGERTVEPPIAIAKCSKLCASTQMTINPDTKPSSPSSSISSILQPRPRTAIGLSALDHRGRPLIGHHKPSPNHWPKTLTLRAGPQIEAMRQGLRELGHIEGQNIAIEFGSASNAAQLSDVAAKLVQLKVDVIFA